MPHCGGGLSGKIMAEFKSPGSANLQGNPEVAKGRGSLLNRLHTPASASAMHHAAWYKSIVCETDWAGKSSASPTISVTKPGHQDVVDVANLKSPHDWTLDEARNPCSSPWIATRWCVGIDIPTSDRKQQGYEKATRLSVAKPATRFVPAMRGLQKDIGERMIDWIAISQ
ncbi:hypothetical protein BDV06DRAFT_80633 [Aspergillus oleicola]